MEKVYVLSNRKDAELEQAIHNMDAYHLRIALYGIARGWKFDEAFSIAEEAAQQSVKQTGQVCTCEDCNAWSTEVAGICIHCELPRR